MYRNQSAKIQPICHEALEMAANILDAGGLVCLPTDTNYCVFCDYTNEAAVQKLYDAKNRDRINPLLISVPDYTHVEKLTVSTETIRNWLKQFWPASFSVILPKTDNIPSFVVCGLPSVGLGCHEHKALHLLFEKRPIPLASSSANTSGKADPKTASDVMHQIGDGVDLIIDGGKLEAQFANTILDLTMDPPIVARQGAVSLCQLRRILPSVMRIASDKEYKSMTQKKVKKLQGEIQ